MAPESMRLYGEAGMPPPPGLVLRNGFNALPDILLQIICLGQDTFCWALSLHFAQQPGCRAHSCQGPEIVPVVIVVGAEMLSAESRGQQTEVSGVLVLSKGSFFVDPAAQPYGLSFHSLALAPGY